MQKARSGRSGLHVLVLCVAEGPAQVVEEYIVPGRSQAGKSAPLGENGVTAEQNGGQTAVLGNLLMEGVEVAAVGQSLLAQTVKGGVAHAAVVQNAGGVEKFRQIHVGRQPGLPQIQVETALLQSLAVAFSVIFLYLFVEMYI